VAHIADGLPYRDFITVGLLLRRMTLSRGRQSRASPNGMPPDNWIYIQEPDVRLGRLQVFNNWSPAMVADPDTIWLGLEYFCRQNDDLWSLHDEQLVDFAARELEAIGMIDRRDVLDATVVRVPAAYPAYFGLYREFDLLRAYLDGFANLFPVGRNGMHRYNNQDHSMLTASSAVGSIINGGLDKSEIWRINTEEEYHEDARVPDERRASA
jgi:protoporphyrinogen oxidase